MATEACQSYFYYFNDVFFPLVLCLYG